jgi:putative tricarboxylic transport membrane protein
MIVILARPVSRTTASDRGTGGECGIDVMSETSNDPGSTPVIVSNRTMEIVVALALMTVATVVLVASYMLGAGWAPFVGPESGYFPFYVALIMLITSTATLLQHVFASRDRRDTGFVRRHEALMVLQVLIPMTIFVVLTTYIGMYLSAFLFIMFFMLWLGKYRIYSAVLVSAAVPAVLFVVFEIWFLVPLPKGPLEAWFGY